MSVGTVSIETKGTTWQTKVRGLSALAGAVIIVDALSVGAPGLALLAVPFLAAAIAMRKGNAVAMVALLLWSALTAVLAINYFVANQFDAPAGDLAFVFVAGPAAAAVSALLASHLPRSRR